MNISQGNCLCIPSGIVHESKDDSVPHLSRWVNRADDINRPTLEGVSINLLAVRYLSSRFADAHFKTATILSHCHPPWPIEIAQNLALCSPDSSVRSCIGAIGYRHRAQ
ncbi:hypothetical protein PoB_004161000 [Plakobranchus ocellatus]|uniref:Uncharacterized protein n=1 Tax=Plakobranchus ocellatus TaxID=259542 RepID=A0AAV4B7N3_9GAST|nr:hypothetical protein PoB_004161000 [Plakobranchus ocellatus]